MCYFKSVKFKLYPERTRLHEDYYFTGETEAEHKKRIMRRRRDQNELNRAQNHCGQVFMPMDLKHLAAERRTNYQA